MTSGICFGILYQCLVRQRILFSRQSTELLNKLTYFYVVYWGDDFRIVSIFSAELGLTADTCTASVYCGLGFSRSFSVKVDSDPEVRFVCGGWTPLSWRRGRFPWFAFLRFSICGTLMRWSSWVVQVLQFVRCFGRLSRSHCCSSFLGPGRLTCPLCSTTDAGCSCMRHEAFSRRLVGPLCTSTEPAFPRHLGGEGVAGSPGV